ncbi:MAG: hypothetical protein PHU18_05300, partial [Dehalococcoidales bacterium]|nr:hypothetical protein [Dehalococcoidales bacterium]
MPVDHKEIAFESAIESSLLNEGGYCKASPNNFDRERALDPSILFPFVKETQPKQWDYLEKTIKENAEDVFLD